MNIEYKLINEIERLNNEMSELIKNYKHKIKQLKKVNKNLESELYKQKQKNLMLVRELNEAVVNFGETEGYEEYYEHLQDFYY